MSTSNLLAKFFPSTLSISTFWNRAPRFAHLGFFTTELFPPISNSDCPGRNCRETCKPVVGPHLMAIVLKEKDITGKQVVRTQSSSQTFSYYPISSIPKVHALSRKSLYCMIWWCQVIMETGVMDKTTCDASVICSFLNTKSLKCVLLTESQLTNTNVVYN